MIEQFIQFVINHWALWALFAITLALIIWQELRTQVGGVQQLSPQQAVDLINRKDAKVIDLRPNTSFDKGHILGATHLAKETLGQKPKVLEKNKGKPIILVCETGQQSLQEGVKLRKTGIADVYNIRGGMTAWKSANLPLSKQQASNS